ncbi:MAG: diaminopimelate decarboxylase [Chloroflexota bacterium]|nr:diaminopimelate decarboxylase [Chloroflexota bacterium]
MWPVTTQRNSHGVMEIGGVSLVDIAAEFGTPIYVYDERTLRQTARGFRNAFTAAYPQSRVVYAAKAFLTTAIVQILHQEGLGLDVVSGGELAVGLRSGMPPSEISLHGNNKSREELQEALDAGIGMVIVDNVHDIDLLAPLVVRRETPIQVMLRINPGVDVHTHRKISTGLADSKFGLPLVFGQAETAVARLVGTPGLNLVGYHAHVGSQLFDSEATVSAIDELLSFAAAMRDRHGVELQHLSPGGGFGIAYVEGDRPMGPGKWATMLANAVRIGCDRHTLPLPALTIEPGRAIAGPAGVALYTVGAIKDLPGIRTYVAVDGGMADNIRPALYEAVYSAEIANRQAGGVVSDVTIAGKYCESGDVLIDEIDLPPLVPGDLLALPAAGAYCLSMASNYNMALKPAVVLVDGGSVRLIRRRETYDDLLRCDVPIG